MMVPIVSFAEETIITIVVLIMTHIHKTVDHYKKDGIGYTVTTAGETDGTAHI